MPTIIDGTLGLTTPTYGGADTSEYLVPVTQFKNRILNGSMVLDQRNAGASVATTSPFANIYTLDRWFYSVTAASKFTIQQNAGSVTPPVGFTNYLGCTSTSAYSVSSSDAFSIRQTIEGFNIADLAWGTANAKTVTLSFQVYSSLTGTFGGSIYNSAVNRCYPFSYTIPAANTWTQISVTIAGDTTGTWLTNNGAGLTVNYSLGTGSTGSGTAGAWGSTFFNSATGATSVVGTNGATFYITGVQLEVGSTATSFDYRPYGTELQLCQRYLPAWTAPGSAEGLIAAGGCANTTVGAFTVIYPVTTRVPPTGVSVTNATHFSTWFTTSVGVGTGISFAGRASTQACQINLTTSGLTTGAAASLGFNSNATSSSVFLLTGCEL